MEIQQLFTYTIFEAFADVRNWFLQTQFRLLGILYTRQTWWKSKSVTRKIMFEMQSFHNQTAVLKEGVVQARSEVDVVSCRMTGDLHFVIIDSLEICAIDMNITGRENQFHVTINYNSIEKFHQLDAAN